MSLINNQGDIGAVLKELGSSDSIKSLATSMLAAGLSAGIGQAFPQLMPQALPGSSAFTAQLSQLPMRLARNVLTGVIRSSITAAIQGGNVGDLLLNSLRGVAVDEVLAATQAAIGDFTDGLGARDLPVANLLAHAVAGGLAAEAMGNDFAAGAASALVSTFAAHAGVYEGLNRQQIDALSQVLGAAAALMVGGDGAEVNQGAGIASSAALNNYLTHEQLKIAEKAAIKLAKCERGLITCSDVERKRLAETVEYYQRLSWIQTMRLAAACENGQTTACRQMLKDAKVFSQRVATSAPALIYMGYPGAASFAVTGSDLYSSLESFRDVDALLVKYYERALADPNYSFEQASRDIYREILRDDSWNKLKSAAGHIASGIALAAAAGTCPETGVTCLLAGILAAGHLTLGGNQLEQAVRQQLMQARARSVLEQVLVDQGGYTREQAEAFLESAEGAVAVGELILGGTAVLKSLGLQVEIRIDPNTLGANGGNVSIWIRKVNGRRPMNYRYAGKIYELPGELGKKYPHGVPFTKTGYPDFSRYAKVTVRIRQTGNRERDFKLANEAAGFSSTPEGYTWHHHQDGVTMQLVPRDLHKAVSHTGGVAHVRARE